MILVTGGTGLLGAHLLYKLTSSGIEVRATYRDIKRLNITEKIFSYYHSSLEELMRKIDWVKCDLLDIENVKDTFEGIRSVYHCAAKVSFHSKDAQELMQNNATATNILVNQCLVSGIEHLVYVSSVAALGREANKSFYNENSHWKDSPENSVYGLSKYKAEMEVWRGIEEGLNAAIVNPVIILGPGAWKESSSTIFETIEKGFNFYTPGANGFVDVRDVVEAMVTIANKKINRERFVLVSENMFYKDLFSLIAKGLNKKKPRIEAKRWMLWLLLYFQRTRELLGGPKAQITSETAASAFRISNYSADKAINQLGIKFIPIEHSVRDICKLKLSDSKA